MRISNEQDFDDSPLAQGFWSLHITGVILLAGAGIVAAQVIWEQTVETWTKGPQMILFTFIHSPAAVLLLSLPALLIWVIVTLGLMVLARIRKRKIHRFTFAALGLAVLMLVVVSLPEAFWQRLLISQMARSPHAADLMVYTAYRGDAGTMRSFLSHGVPVGATDHWDWRTALHAAATNGDAQAIRCLISAGADVNALDRFGDSPLELAESHGNEAAAQLLRQFGAKRIRGDEASRSRALEDQLRESTRD